MPKTRCVLEMMRSMAASVCFSTAFACGSVRSDFTRKFSSFRPAASVAFARSAASSAPARGMSTR